MSLTEILSKLNSELKALGAQSVLVVREDGINVLSSEKKQSLEQGVFLSGMMHALHVLSDILNSHEKCLYNDTFFIQEISIQEKIFFVLITYQKSKITSRVRFDLHNYFLSLKGNYEEVR